MWRKALQMDATRLASSSRLAATGWRALRATPSPVSIRLRRAVHCLAEAEAAMADPAGAAREPQALRPVAPPPTVPFCGEAVNSVSISGSVLTEPQIRCFPANQVAASVRLGLPPRAFRAGVPQPPAGAITVDAWGSLALQLAQHVRKGSRIAVRGHLREDTWLDRSTGERRWMAKLVAQELALLASYPEGELEQHHEAEHPAPAEWQPAGPQPAVPPPQVAKQAAQLAAKQAPRQAAQPAAAQQAAAADAPRVSSSALKTQHLFEVEGLTLDAIALARAIKPSTVFKHLLEAAAAGSFSAWGRLSAEVQLGPEGGPRLTPSEVAAAAAAVDAATPGLGLQKLPLREIRARLEEGPATAPKVAALLAQRGGDPALLYSALQVVLAALTQGVPFSAISGGDT